MKVKNNIKASLQAKKVALTANTLAMAQAMFTLTDEQKQAFIKDSKSNLRGVRANAARIIKDMPELKDELTELLRHHDESKYHEPEHYGYVWSVAQKRLDQHPDIAMVNIAVRVAMLHHKQNNAHHLEYWEAREGTEYMPPAVLAHYFADLVYGCQEDNSSLTDTVQSVIQTHFFTNEQIALLKRWTELFPELNY